ncbi:hypothetical protein [Flavobacterium ginsenosidimutans]|uniref:Uncharacterized protein n=1 Tax=Flavobacterium ginsenosidimutans TaxID=687844 RepID=A0ABZ2Q0F6_9FLAO|nr:hypothetical protein [Flavobacterium ginsenosidimutans]KAF2338998.1 hypothetical protein DM444_00495 [Flavobacterium ginsenosidimutans]
MIIENKVIEHFGSNLIIRAIEFSLSQKLTKEEELIISSIGLPSNILNFEFVDNISLLSESEIIIGKTSYNSNIILNLKSRVITRDNEIFISKSLKNLVLQLYTYDHLWTIDIPEKKFGNYREDSNHKKYAKYLEIELLKIDSDLFKNDNGYLWGSLVEDIEFGIVG